MLWENLIFNCFYLVMWGKTHILWLPLLINIRILVCWLSGYIIWIILASSTEFWISIFCTFHTTICLQLSVRLTLYGENVSYLEAPTIDLKDTVVQKNLKAKSTLDARPKTPSEDPTEAHKSHKTYYAGMSFLNTLFKQPFRQKSGGTMFRKNTWLCRVWRRVQEVLIALWLLCEPNSEKKIWVSIRYVA